MSLSKCVLSKLLAASAVSLALSALGCSQGTDGAETPTSEEDLTENTSGNAVTVLQAWLGETVGQPNPRGPALGDKQLDLSMCDGSDCTDAARAVLDSVLVGPFTYREDGSGQCETYEIRTVIRASTFEAPAFLGIGFHLSTAAEHPLNFVPKEELLRRASAGEVVLEDGAKALVHRFVAQGMCFGLGGNGGSVMSRSYAFKPYVELLGSATDRHRTWDSVESNYRLGRSADGSWIPSFDRQGELLTH